MSFQDIFKSSFLENISSISMIDMIIALTLALLLGVFIFFVYKKSYTGVMYSDSFGITLIALCLITTLLIMTVISNIVLSLGMVGALSIVRFRTAIKEPLDIAFLFWSIAVGIVLAAGLIPLAVFGSVFIGIILLIFSQKKTFDSPYILILHCENTQIEQQVYELIVSQVKKINLKSKSIENGSVELNYEVRLKQDNRNFLARLEEMQGVHRVILVSYNGDYMG